MSRISSHESNANVLFNIMSIEKNMSELSNKISTGRKINFFHDDPTAMSLTLKYQQVSVEADNYQRQIDASRAWLDETDSTLQSMSTVTQRAKDLAVKAANGSNDDDSLSAIAQEVGQIIDQMVALGNAQYDGRYIFSGQQINNAPFKMTVSPSGETVEYTGDSNSLKRRIGPSSYIDVSTPGSDVFYPRISKDTDISSLRSGQGIADGDIEIQDKNGNTATVTISSPPMNTVGDVLDAVNGAGIGVFARINTKGDSIDIVDISGGNGRMAVRDVANVTAQNLGIAFDTDKNEINGENLYPDDSTFRSLVEFKTALENEDFDTIRDKTIGDLSDAIDRIVNALSEVGAKTNRLDFTEQRLSDSKFHMDELASKERDLDLAEGIMELRELETVQQAALAMGSRLMQVSLADYL
jgi:flagellar hook-associated protein 3 FlgL